MVRARFPSDWLAKFRFRGAVSTPTDLKRVAEASPGRARDAPDGLLGIAGNPHGRPGDAPGTPQGRPGTSPRRPKDPLRHRGVPRRVPGIDYGSILGAPGGSWQRFVADFNHSGPAFRSASPVLAQYPHPYLYLPFSYGGSVQGLRHSNRIPSQELHSVPNTSLGPRPCPRPGPISYVGPVRGLSSGPSPFQSDSFPRTPFRTQYRPWVQAPVPPWPHFVRGSST